MDKSFNGLLLMFFIGLNVSALLFFTLYCIFGEPSSSASASSSSQHSYQLVVVQGPQSEDSSKVVSWISFLGKLDSSRISQYVLAAVAIVGIGALLWALVSYILIPIISGISSIDIRFPTPIDEPVDPSDGGSTESPKTGDDDDTTMSGLSIFKIVIAVVVPIIVLVLVIILVARKRKCCIFKPRNEAQQPLGTILSPDLPLLFSIQTEDYAGKFFDLLRNQKDYYFGFKKAIADDGDIMLYGNDVPKRLASMEENVASLMHRGPIKDKEKCSRFALQLNEKGKVSVIVTLGQLSHVRLILVAYKLASELDSGMFVLQNGVAGGNLRMSDLDWDTDYNNHLLKVEQKERPEMAGHNAHFKRALQELNSLQLTNQIPLDPSSSRPREIPITESRV